MRRNGSVRADGDALKQKDRASSTLTAPRSSGYSPANMKAVPLLRQIRAEYSDTEVVVWQAYGEAIAAPALAAQTFIPPFRRERMTWVKPSFLWMMYRSGWATKPGQERVLRISLAREGFDWILARAVPTRHVPELFESSAEWQSASRRSPVLMQWDPERDLHLRPLDFRTVQLGLRGEAVDHYVERWIRRIEDATDLAHRIHALVRASDDVGAAALLPAERPYPPRPIPRLEFGTEP
jgi:hypothetical protein